MDIGQRRIDRSLARVGLGRQAHIECSLSQVNTTLGIPNDLGRFKRSVRYKQGLRIGVTDVFEAWIMMRRAINLGSSPASIMRASQ